MTRVRLLVASLLALLAAFTVVPAPAGADAGPKNLWYVHYGALVTGTSPNVWSNRQPTWSVGTADMNMTFDPNGNLRISGTTCPAGNAHVCWSSHTANVGPGPHQAYWDSRPTPTINSGDFRIYSNEGVVRFDTHTGGWVEAQMILWSNGCLDIYTRSATYQNWGAPLWANSTSPACAISQ